MRFRDRTDAGRRLADRLHHLRDGDPVVVGLPRGGVPVAFEVAHALGAPLDVLVVRKLGVPFHTELAMGAIGEDGVRVLNERVLRLARIPDRVVNGVERHARRELERRLHRLRRGKPAVPIAGRTVIVVDDGVATGSTARAACQVARARGASRVVLAVPVGAPDTIAALADVADEVVCLDTPSAFDAVGQSYLDFGPISDDVVVALLARAQTRMRAPNELAVAPAANHLFEEPSALGPIATLAADWLLDHAARGNPLRCSPRPGRGRRVGACVPRCR